MIGVTQDMLYALDRCIASQQALATQIDAANPGDNYASLLVREDIEQLEDLRDALGVDAAPKAVDGGM